MSHAMRSMIERIFFELCLLFAQVKQFMNVRTAVRTGEPESVESLANQEIPRVIHKPRRSGDRHATRKDPESYKSFC